MSAILAQPDHGKSPLDDGFLSLVKTIARILQRFQDANTVYKRFMIAEFKNDTILTHFGEVLEQ